MIPQITEINFPAYATLNNATVTLAEMGDRTITTQIKIDGDIVPDFTGWALEFKGERFVLPTKEPQAAKDNTSRRSTVDLTFTSWAVNELKRYFFVEMASITAGTAIADKYKASLGLNLENFVIAFNNVLDYYFAGQIRMDLFGAGTGMYSQEPSFVEIDNTYIWEVLQKVYEIYDVRWTFAYDDTNHRYLIKVGYPAPEIDDHDFEYGYQGGLLRFERQVQDYDITNVLLGRGGEKNLPYRYFKKVDPNNPEWQADPDAIPELKNIYFENLRDINFRRYVQGWKTNPLRMLEEGDVIEDYDTERAETDWAYAKGHTDAKFNPVEYVKDDDSIALYGEHWGALENNENIFPSIQGIEVPPYGRIDEVVDVEPITTDDIEAMAADAAVITNVQGATRTEWIPYNNRLVLEITGADFTVPENKTGNLTMVGTWVKSVQYGKKNGHQDNIEPDSAIANLVNIDTTNSYIVAVRKDNSQEYPISGLAAGSYYYKMHIEVRSEFEREQYDEVSVTVGVDSLKLTVSEGTANAWKPTFDIWVKNIWDTTQGANETDAAYAARVWEPILGDRTGAEAAVVFSTGFLSISADYNFVIASIPVVDRTKTIDGVASEWRITLIKSDAEYDATGKYIPNSETGGNASAGDFFYFTGIDMPWIYVKWAEERLNAYKETELAKIKQINPTWVVQIDKVRANTKEQGELEYLADRFASGAKLRVRDKRFTNNNILTLYVQTITYTWQQPSSGNPYLVPDIEVVLSDKIVSVESPIDRLEGSVDLIQTSYAKISDIEGAIRRVASPIFLKKTGESEMSLSPTRFSSIVSSESFRQGDIGGQGWGAYVDGEGHTVLEADTVVVRKDMRVNTLTVNQIAYLGGKQIISAAAMECNRVEEVNGGYKCYFDQKQGSVANLFKVDDVVLGQVWNADESELRYYKRKVIAIDSDSITLSSSIADGTGVPHPKDIMVQYGSYSDTSRQYVILRDVIGGGYERMLSGLTSVYTDGTEYYFAGRQDGSTPRWFVGDALGQYASYQNGVLNIAGRLAVTTQIDTGNGTYTALSNYLSNLQDQIDGTVQTWYAAGEPTLNNYPANTWATVEDKNNHIGDLYYDSDTGKAYRFMLDGNTYKWVQLADEDIAAALALAQQNQTAIAGLQYLKAATNQGTLVQGGLVLTSMIQLGQTEQGVYKVYSGINGIMDSTALGNGIAAWYGGQMADKVADNTLTDYAKSLFRFDGSGYLASGNIKWDLNGNGEIPGISWNNGRITLSSDIYLQGGDRLTALIDAVNRMYSQFAYDSQDHITVAPTHALYIPTASPEYPIAGKVALYYDYNGLYSEIPSDSGGGDVYDLIYKKNGTTITTINLGTAEGIINVTVGWNDLTPDANHRFLTDTLINTWNAKYSKPSGGIPKTDLASAVQTSLGKADTALQSYTETDPTVPAWAKAANKPSYTASEVGALPDDTFIPSKTSDLTNDSGFITGYTETDPVFSASAAAGITSANITAWNSKYSKPSGGIPKTDLASDVQTSLGKADTALQSFTETDPTVPSWAKASTKPSYSLSEISGTSDLQAIEALTGTTGLLRKTAANTWELDTATYLVASDHKALTLKVGTATVGSDYTSLAAKTYTITKQNITDAIGSSTYAPYNANGYVPTTRKVNGHALSADVTVTKGDVGLGNVENTALSTWTGSSHITTLGTITTGVWNGTAIANQYLANSSISIEGQSVSLGGSLTNHLVTLSTEQTITGSKKLKSVSLLNVPASAPASADIETGKFYLYATTLGEYSETPSGGDTGTIYDLTLRKNGTSLGTYNLGEQAADVNIPIGWSDLTPDSTHRFLTDTQISTWNAKQDAINDLSTIRTQAGEGHTAYGWGNHASAGYATQSSVNTTVATLTPKVQAIPYIVGPSTDTTAGTWTGTYEGITALTEGLTIIYVPHVAGATTTTLNINGLGAKTCYWTGTSKMTTQYPAGTPILLTYYNNGWRRADYNSNTTYSAGTKALFDAGENTSNRVWSASVLASAVAPKVHEHNWTDINNAPAFITADALNGYATEQYVDEEITALNLGTASQKDYTTSVAQNGTGLPTSGAVYSAIAAAVTSALHYRGISSVALTDGGTETAVIGGVSLVPQSGDVVIYGGFEFLWENNVWNKLGDDSSYALKTVQVIAGTGLTGGGNLSSNVTVSLSQATITSLGKADTALQSSALDGYVNEIATGTGNYITGVSKSGKKLTFTYGTLPTTIAWTNVTGRPTELSDFTNDIISDWALASTKPTYALSEITGTDDLQAIEALTGTSGLLKKTAANTWTLDTNTYLTSSSHKAFTLKVGTITIGSDYTSLAAKTYTITKANITDTIGSTTYAPYNADGYVPTTRTVNGHALSSNVTVTKGDVGLGNVENTALSTWTGTNKITTVGTITTGTWHGTAIANSYLANSSVTINSKSLSLGGSLTLKLSDLTDDILSGHYLPLSGGTLTGALSGTSASFSDVTVSSKLAIPTSAPSSPDSSKVYLYASSLGEYSETPGGGGSATVYDLTYKKNGTTISTINLGNAAGIINVTIGWSDLTPDASHRFVSDTEKNTWNAKLSSVPIATSSVLGGVKVGTGLSVTSAGVLSVNTSVIASQSWVDQFVSESIETALGDLGAAAYKDFTTSVTSGSADLVTSGAVYTAVNAKYTKPSGGIPKTDLASAVQTTLSNADTAYGWGNHASAGYLTSSSLDGYVNEIATGTGNYISGVSKSGKKLTFTYGTLPTTIAWGSVTGKPTTISGYGITDAKIETPSGTSNRKITLGSNNFTIYSWALASAKPSYTFSEIGSKPTTIDGYGITSVPEAYLTWGGKNLAGTYAPIDAAMVDVLGANRMAFPAASAITIEYSRDGGTTWTDYGATNDQKVGLFSGIGQAFNIGHSSSTNPANSNCQLRVIYKANLAPVYTVLNKFIMFVSSSGSSACRCTIDVRNKDNSTAGIDSWVTIADNVPISGWSGYNVINTTGVTCGGAYYWDIRFTFTATHTSEQYTTGLTIQTIRGFGGMGWSTSSSMSAAGRLYSYDASQNMIVPASIRPKTNNTATFTLGTSGYKWYAVYATTLYGNLDWSYIQNKPTLDSIADGSTRKLANYLPLTGGTINNTSSTSPLSLKNNNTNGDIFLSFVNASETIKVGLRAPYSTYGLTLVDTSGNYKKIYHEGNLTLSTLGGVPDTRKVNNKALSADITLSLDDVADGSTRKLANYLPLAAGSSSALTGTLYTQTILPNGTTYTLGSSRNPWSEVRATTFYGNLALSYITGADDLQAIEALTGTSGFLKKTAANTWSLDTTTYVPTSRKVNNKALSADITLSLDDIADGSTRKLANYLPLTGGNLTGNLTTDNGKYIAVGGTGQASGTSSNYLSAGKGYGKTSGLYGVKVVSCDQSNCQSGLGQDLANSGLTGWDNNYNMCVVGCHQTSGSSYISFVSHTVNNTTYDYMGGFKYTSTGTAGYRASFYVAGHIGCAGDLTVYQDTYLSSLTVNDSADIGEDLSVGGVLSATTGAVTTLTSTTASITNADVSGKLAIPTVAPTSPVYAKYYLYVNPNGNYSE